MQAPFSVFDGFIETGFEQRFQGLLRLAWQQRSWHVIVADPGSGKSMGIRDLVESRTAPHSPFSGRTLPLLAVTAPKNDPKEQALGNYILMAMNFPTRGRWSDRKYTLIHFLQHYGVECVIIDDAHDLSMQHLILLKELTDQLRLPPYNHALGLCLVTAGRGGAIPLKDILDQPETMWIQFRRRLDRLQPYCRIAGHTEVEVRDILVALEQVYQPLFPTLRLQRWTRTIYTWLTHPLLDPQNGKRVSMDNLIKLVTTALQWSHAQAQTDITTAALEAAAQLLMHQHDRVYVIDAPDAKDAPTPSKEEAPTEPSAPRPKKRRRMRASQPEMSSDLPSSDEQSVKEAQAVSKEELPTQLSVAHPKKRRRVQARQLDS